MIRPGDVLEASRLQAGLRRFETLAGPLLGLTEQSRDVFVAQLVESQRRVRYVQLIRRGNSPHALDSQSKSFDPLKGAVLSVSAGNFDEACWLVFLSVHFGRHRKHKWALSAAFYGRLGQGEYWTWPEVSKDPEKVLEWLEENEKAIRALGLGFGNHRKYQSLRARGSVGTGTAIVTYVEWVGISHLRRFADVTAAARSPMERFSALYDSLRSVRQFGRVARFDYLAMIGKLGLFDVEADSMHLVGASGPLVGARLLLSGDRFTRVSAHELEQRLAPLREELGVPYDVLEDALCNWQKSPSTFVPFRG